jgi:hypothetical protein
MIISVPVHTAAWFCRPSVTSFSELRTHELLQVSSSRLARLGRVKENSAASEGDALAANSGCRSSQDFRGSLAKMASSVSSRSAVRRRSRWTT